MRVPTTACTPESPFSFATSAACNSSDGSVIGMASFLRRVFGYLARDAALHASDDLLLQEPVGRKEEWLRPHIVRAEFNSARIVIRRASGMDGGWPASNDANHRVLRPIRNDFDRRAEGTGIHTGQ